jgi:hypothetical protein
MHSFQSIKGILEKKGNPPVVSPFIDPARPDYLLLHDADGFRKLFSGRLLSRSPGLAKRQGLMKDFFYKNSLLKFKADMARGFDISVTPYPMEPVIAAWGIITDSVGRVFDIKDDGKDYIELCYQGGCCRNSRDWIYHVEERGMEIEAEIKRFYSKLRILSADRIVPAASMGFGIWDAFWMSFDIETAFRLIDEELDFALLVFDFWRDFHLSACAACLDAGIELIFFRENPAGFPQNASNAARLDVFLRERYQVINELVQSRGGTLIFDCDSDDMLETDYPTAWGFNGIGPMLFRDEDDFQTARKCLPGDLILIGSVLLPEFGTSEIDQFGPVTGIMYEPSAETESIM